MIDVDVYLWETIFTLKAVYDHNPDAPVLRLYKSAVMNGDYVDEIAENSIDQFFTDTRVYYNEEKEILTYVFYDPIITNFCKLCDEYEKCLQLKPEENQFKNELKHDIYSALDIPDYSYDVGLYCDTAWKNGCRIVMLCYCEFYSYHMIPAALKEAYDAFAYHTSRLKEAIVSLDQAKPIELFELTQQKEAAL